ncbi:Cytoskeleton-associated protein 2-like protein [Heterocephalus glaber]|uniref:Cytoskeleton-associated protein 2-like protein n=1 Tax=Heterocephalus glaber TaxID=10181 RepID=G5C317_HETGA|nr:Cytoskeleton-associated protein 2-like protein [Heterocephalus glaber]
MVGSGPSAATVAFATTAKERQKKLQEYLAAKGKLKNQNTKPYLKAKNNCPNLPPSKSTIKPQKDVFNYDVLCVKCTRPISIKLQSRPANITGSQKPKLEAPKLVGKSLTSRGFSSNPKCKPSNESHQHHEARSSAKRELSRKSMRLPIAQKPKTAEQQLTGQANARCTDSVDNNYVEKKSLYGIFKELNKENVPQTLSEPEKKPDPALCTTRAYDLFSYHHCLSAFNFKNIEGRFHHSQPRGRGFRDTIPLLPAQRKGLPGCCSTATSPENEGTNNAPLHQSEKTGKQVSKPNFQILYSNPKGK